MAHAAAVALKRKLTWLPRSLIVAANCSIIMLYELIFSKFDVAMQFWHTKYWLIMALHFRNNFPLLNYFMSNYISPSVVLRFSSKRASSLIRILGIELNILLIAIYGRVSNVQCYNHIWTCAQCNAKGCNHIWACDQCTRLQYMGMCLMCRASQQVDQEHGKG